MRLVDTKFLDCIEMCSYVEKKTMEKELKRRLETDLCAYMMYVCGKKANKLQLNYINSMLNLNFSEAEEVRQDAVLEKMDVIHSFLTADRCFGSSDTRYHGKKAEVLIELFTTAGEDLCAMCENDSKQKEAHGRMNTYVQKMHALILSENPGSVHEEVLPVDDGKTLEELVSEFNKLTGLQSVKDEINGLINLVKVSQMRKERGFKESSVSKHMVFTGNPGTGKTTVARLLANIYHKLGVLSKGQLVEVDRSGLVAGYTGQTALKTDKVVQEAKGGILFIDEAYTLTEDKGEGDFGQEAVDTILKAMEDNRDDLVVIVAGYPDLMAGFLSSNPGLKSRFNKFIEFEDYNKDELVSIFLNMCESMDYKMFEEHIDLLKDKVQSIIDGKAAGFANARSMRNMLEHAIMKQATRIVEMSDPTNEELITIKFEDLDGYIIQ